MPKRNLLLLVENTSSAMTARDIACGFAAEGNSMLTCLQITEADSSTIISTETMISKQLVRNLQLKSGDHEPTTSDAACLAEHEISYREKTLSGPKYAVLSQEGEANDLILLGREGNFVEESENAKEVINLMLEYRPRPLVIVPPNPPEGSDILVAYSGGPRSSRALQLFVLMGLAEGKQLHLLCVDRSEKAAQSKIDCITTFLRQHDVSSTSTIIVSRGEPTDVILSKIREETPSMLVAGAKGTNGWRQAMFGSTGDYLIRHCPVPLFTCP